MKNLAISVDTKNIADLIDGRAHGRLRESISKGVQRSLATIQMVHKMQVVTRGGGAAGPSGSPWTKRTGEAGRSFHIAWSRGDIEGAYGSELVRVGVLEMGTQEALGGPLRPRNGRYLAIPTSAARVGVGRAAMPRDRSDLYFAKNKRGDAFLFQKDTDRLMYVLRTQVTIPPHPTLAQTQEKAQPQMDAIMLDAASNWMRSA